MENALCFHNATVVTGYSLMENGCVYVKDGKIEDVFSERRFLNKRFSPEVRIVDVGKAYIAPGLIDTHIHGFAGFGTEDCSPDSILGMSKALAEYGVTAYPYKVVIAPDGKILKLFTGESSEFYAYIKRLIK